MSLSQRFHVFLGKMSFNRVSCCCRCKAPRSGLVRLEGVEETSPDWAVRVEINEVGSQATVTAYQKRLATVNNNAEDQNVTTTALIFCKSSLTISQRTEPSNKGTDSAA